MENTVNERIKYLIEDQNLTATAYAQKINVLSSSMSHILSGRNKPSLEFISRLTKEFTNVNVEWLINGVGEAYKSKPSDVTNVKTNTGRLGDSNLAQRIFESTKRNDSSKEKVKKEIETPTKIEKIVIFYTNNTFREFSPSEV